MIQGLFYLVAATAENHQHVLKHQDEIKVKGQGTDDCAFSDHCGIQAGRLGNGHGFELLGVVGGQPGKDQHADIADDHLHGRAFQEKIDDRRDE